MNQKTNPAQGGVDEWTAGSGCRPTGRKKRDHGFQPVGLHLNLNQLSWISVCLVYRKDTIYFAGIDLVGWLTKIIALRGVDADLFDII